MQKLRIGSIVIVLCLLGWSVGSFGGAVLALRGELHIVDNNPSNWASITVNVMEHLWELDSEGKLVPRLATSWQWLDARTLEVKLRHGVRFHNGEVFDAAIVQLNWDQHRRLR